MITPISDLTTRTLQMALQGVTERRQAHQANIANIETPGYLAQTVSFEDSLARARAAGSPESFSTTFNRATTPTNMNGNNVNVDSELVGLTETSLTQQLIVEALNAKYRLLRTSIGVS